MRRLEIASGYQPYRPDDPEWEHLDVNPNAPHVKWVADMTAPLPFADGTFGEIRAVDCLEHISYRDTERVLHQWVRVLAPGGRIYIQTPDAEQMMVRYLSQPQQMITEEFSEMPPIVSIAWRILGGHADGDYNKPGDDWRWNAHYALFSRDSLGWYLERVGLHVDSIERNPFPNLLAWATKN